MKNFITNTLVIACMVYASSCGGKKTTEDESLRADDVSIFETSDWQTLAYDTSFTGADSATQWPADIFVMEKDIDEAFEQLAQKQFTSASDWTIALPVQEAIADFNLKPSSLIPEKLQEKFGNVRVFRAVHKNDSSVQASVVYAPQGISILITSGNSNFELISPVGARGRKSFLKTRLGNFGRRRFVETPPSEKAADESPEAALPGPGSISQRHIFRIAIAATAEYTAYHGGEQNAFAAMATSLSHVNLVYEREMGISFRMVDDNDRLIFTDAATDGYSNHDAVAMNPENQKIIDDIIGNTNYDIGHVFASSKGGFADGTICNTSTKAYGASGLSNPIGHPFDISYVAHELGHQFGGRHTFNGSRCEPAAREPRHNVEPGSGSTIMAYAGICGEDNLQDDSDTYFNIINLRQIMSMVKKAGCAHIEETENHVPVAKVAASRYHIPPATAFVLSGYGQDADNDELSYCWEQMDVHPARQGIPLGQDHNIAAVFRSLAPTTDTFRIFPRPADLVSNARLKQEILTGFNRDLNFNLTVRDNNGAFSVANTRVSVVRGSGTFAVTSHNTARSIVAGTEQTITWSVGRSDRQPINCSHVDISLSLDGGLTFQRMLLEKTPNDGSETVTIPGEIRETNVRIKVAASNNIFFDINNADLNVTQVIASK